MASPESASHESQVNLRFIVAVVDGCIESEQAALELAHAGLLPQSIQMFYAHRKPVHPKPIGLPFSRLQVMFRYMEDLLELDASTSSDYEAQMRAGRHVLLTSVYCDTDAKAASSVLGRAHSHNGCILGYGHAAKLLTLPV